MEKEFFDFIKERQLIWHKRFFLKENPPWTRDVTLQKYKILNVYRELDKGTIYIFDKFKDFKVRKTILLNVVFYRFFNRFNLYESLGIAPVIWVDEKLACGLKIKLDNLRKQGKPMFNDAYLIAGKKGEQKHVSVLNSLIWLDNNLDYLIDGIDRAKTPEESFKVIMKIPLVGKFLAYEIWTDLTYFDFFRQRWTDNDFVNIGPGAKSGLEIIYGKSGLSELKRLYEIQTHFLKENWKKISYKDAFSGAGFLSLRNIEHSLCEFRKYWNLKQGKGKKRFFVKS